MSLKQLLDLAGRTALITGGSRGLGLQIAEGFLEMGARVIVSARKADELESAAAHLTKFGEANWIAADSSDPTQVARLAEDAGLFLAVALAGALAKRHKIELMVVGRVDGRTKNKLKNQTAFRIQFMDTVAREHIPWLMRSSHLLYSAEINPPCPNSVIEALACGLPVVGFETGSLAEIVQGEAGGLVPYGADPWSLAPPDLPSLARAAEEVLDEQPTLRRSARERAEAAFDVESMADRYLKVLLPGL